jgi:hypothetical protein
MQTKPSVHGRVCPDAPIELQSAGDEQQTTGLGREQFATTVNIANHISRIR